MGSFDQSNSVLVSVALLIFHDWRDYPVWSKFKNTLLSITFKDYFLYYMTQFHFVFEKDYLSLNEDLQLWCYFVW